MISLMQECVCFNIGMREEAAAAAAAAAVEEVLAVCM